jgi:hypothetical protein
MTQRQIIITLTEREADMLVVHESRALGLRPFDDKVVKIDPDKFPDESKEWRSTADKVRAAKELYLT